VALEPVRDVFKMLIGRGMGSAKTMPILFLTASASISNMFFVVNEYVAFLAVVYVQVVKPVERP